MGGVDLHNGVADAHHQQEHGVELRSRNRSHEHGDGQYEDGHAAAYQGTDGEDQGPDQEGGDGQLGQVDGQQVYYAGGAQQVAEYHDSQGVEHELGLKGCAEEGLDLSKGELLYEEFQHDAGENSHPYRGVEGEHNGNGQEDGPDALDQQLPVHALGLLIYQAGLLGDLAQVYHITCQEQADYNRQHTQYEGGRSNQTVGQGDGDEDIAVSGHEGFRNVTEVAGYSSGFSSGERIVHSAAHDGAADQHGAGCGQTTQHEGHHRGVDAAVVEQAVHGLLTAGQLLAGLHHTLQEGDAVQHQQGVDGVGSDQTGLQSRQNEIHGHCVDHNNHDAGDGHNQVQRLLHGQKADDDGKDYCQLDE